MLVSNEQKDKAIKKLYNNALQNTISNIIFSSSLQEQINKYNNLRNKKAFLTRKTLLDQKNVYDIPELKNVVIQNESLIQFYNQGDYSKIENELKTFKTLNKHLYDLIKYYCDMTDNPIQKVIYQVRQKKNQLIIKNIIISNVLNLNKKYQNLNTTIEKPQQQNKPKKEEQKQISISDNKDIRDIKLILIQLLDETIKQIRTELLNENMVYFFLGYIDQIIPLFNDKISIPLLKNKLISCSNHQLNKLSQEQIQLFINKIINHPMIHIG